MACFMNVPNVQTACVQLSVISCVHCTLGSSDGIFVKLILTERGSGPPGGLIHHKIIIISRTHHDPASDWPVVQTLASDWPN